MNIFMKPISNAVYPNYFSVPDASLNSLLISTGSPYSATASPKLTFNGTTLDVSGNLTATGNILSYGTIKATQFLPRQIVNVVMLSNTDLIQIATRDISFGLTDTLFTYSYIPKITNSYLLIEYQSIYYLNGSSGDVINAYMNVVDTGDNRISSTRQSWNAVEGGGTRSGTIFPIVGRYTNTTVVAKTIRVDVFNDTDADTITIQGNDSTWLKITEIGR
jgi:hypothetical protein